MIEKEVAALLERLAERICEKIEKKQSDATPVSFGGNGVSENDVKLIVIQTVDLLWEKVVKQHIESCPHGKELGKKIAAGGAVLTIITIVINFILRK